MKVKFWWAGLAAVAVLSLSCSSKSTNPGGGNPPPSGNTISIGDNFFNPSSKTVTVGTILMWKNNGSMNHTVTSNSGTELNSGTITPSDTYTDTMNTVGTFGYHCALHGGMNGTITVQ